MTDIEQVIKNNFADHSDIVDENGELRPEVQVVDSETGETVAGYDPNRPITESDYKTAWEKNWERLTEQEQDRITRGDYSELKNCLKHRTRHTLLEYLRQQDRRRIVLLREHLIEIAAYHPEIAEYVMEIVFVCTRLMGGDVETDGALPDDLLVLDEISDSDEEEEVISVVR